MAKPSTIEQLEPTFLEELNRLLRDPRFTQLEITKRVNALLEEAGSPERVSKSAVNRYAMRMKDVREKLQQQRQVAEMMIGQLGAQPAGQVGHLLNEMIRSMAFEAAMHHSNGEEPAPPKLIKELANAVRSLELASSENVKREEEIRKQERIRALEKMAELEKSDGPRRVDPETLKMIRQQIYGITDEPGH